MNMYLIIAAMIAWGASMGDAFLYGQNVGKEHEQTTVARVNQAIRDTRAAAQEGAANAIAALKPLNKTIVRRLSARWLRTLSTLSAACLLTAYASPTRPSLDGQPSPLVVASCPAPLPLTDDSMGALLAKVVEQGITYRECREAGLAGKISGQATK